MNKYTELAEILHIFGDDTTLITIIISNNNILKCNDIVVVSNGWCVCDETVSEFLFILENNDVEKKRKYNWTYHANHVHVHVHLL